MKTKTLIGAAALTAVLLNANVAKAQVEQYLVVASGNDFPESRVQAVEQAGGQILKVFPQIGVAVATSADPAFPARAQGIAGIASVVPDPIAVVDSDAQSMPVDSASKLKAGIEKGADLTSLQWGLQAIQAPAAWALGATGKGVRVAVIDTGILTTHPDLAPNLNLALSTSVVPGEGLEFIPGGSKGNSSHATIVAGIIAADDNGFGTTGVAPDAELVAIKAVADQISLCQVSWIAESLLYAAEIHADIANMSLGWSWKKSNPDPNVVDVPLTVAMRAANFAQRQGVLLVASAGNDSRNWDGDGASVKFPRDLPGVLAVSATAPRDCWALDPAVPLDWPAPYTDYGQRVVDLGAPGGHLDPTLPGYLVSLSGVTARAFAFNLVLSTDTSFGQEGDYEQKGTWNFAYGTSMAAPHVCGAAALAIEAHCGSLTPAQLVTILQQSADDLGKPGNDDYYGAGRVNALRAVLQ